MLKQLPKFVLKSLILYFLLEPSKFENFPFTNLEWYKHYSKLDIENIFF